MVTAALVFADVTKTFSRSAEEIIALDGVSFSTQPGSVTGLIGPDGAGKTTLMRLAATLLQPDHGQVRVMGLASDSDSVSVRSLVGYMPQRFGLYEDLSVAENLDLYADLQGLPVASRQARYAQLMHMTGLAPFMARLAGKLSGGMKQKLGLACALLRSPQLLLLDEATVGVDPVSRRELWQIVYQQVEAGMSVLLSTAYLDEAERCDQVVLLHQGKVLGWGAPEEFSQALKGRTYQVTAASLPPRRLQPLLSSAPGVVDAVVDGDAVRVVMATAEVPDIDTFLRTNAQPALSASVLPVEPRFEDAFVARLMVTPQKRRSPLSMDSVKRVAQPGSADAVIVVQDLMRRFGDFVAVNRVSFSVQRGEIFGLLGANGAGKSTTFRMLCGLLPSSSGEVSVVGQDLRRAAASARSHIGYMAQKFSLYGDLSVMQNLRFFSSAYGLSGKQQLARIDWAIDTFELENYLDENSGSLPQGYKQRLAFAAALMHEPDILFLDEPTSGVDPLARREFWQQTNALAETGVTILVTTHFMDEANYCDRLVIMAAGEVLAEGSPEQMKARVRSAALPAPTMEDAFIHLVEGQDKVVL